MPATRIASAFSQHKSPGRIKFLRIISFSLFVTLLMPYDTLAWDPYEVLGVSRTASLEQIKSAYRALARKLHPDKSDLSDDDAGHRFIELNKAFNILKDPERRNRFDRVGETEDSRSGTYRGRERQRRHARENWTHNGYRTFTFFSTDGNLKKKSITARRYQSEILKESKSRIYFVFFYATFCPSCSMIENTWSKITDELTKFNIGTFTINVDHEPRLARDLGVNHIPFIACLVDGQLKHYQQSELSLASLVRFAKQSLPNNLIAQLFTESEQDRFITLGPQQNRRVLIIVNNEENPRLRFRLLAFELSQYYKFGHISLKSSDYSLFSKKYKLKFDDRSQACHIMVFDEFIERPVLNLNYKSNDFDPNHLRKELLKWPFLKLTKLSTQQRFDDLCLYTIPRDGQRVQPRLCVILFTTPNPSTRNVRNKLIEFIRLNNLEHDERVAFAMLDPSKQTEFVSNLLEESGAAYPFRSEPIDSAIILLERQPQDGRKAHYRWLDYRWLPEKQNELDRAKLSLFNLAQQYKNNLPILKGKVILKILADEEGPGLIDRVFWRFVNHVLRLTGYITSQESFSLIVVFISCALVTSLFLYQIPSSSAVESDAMETEFARSPRKTTNPPDVQPGAGARSDDGLKIMELRAETYNGMVRLLKPGYRSIILLTDCESKAKLIPSFKKAVWPYRRNKTLLFGYLCLDKNITWYKSLLQQVTGINDLHVNKRNCIGTVLSLNGFKKYLRVYHDKHHDIDQYDSNVDNDGSFFGTDESQDIEKCSISQSESHLSNGSICAVDNLLDRLPIWLDKMFDGLTKRYFLDYWPEDIN